MIEKHDDIQIAEAYQQVNERLADTKLGRMAYDHIPGANKLMQSPTPTYDDEPTAQAEPEQSAWQKLAANPDAGVAAARKAAEGKLSEKAMWLWLKVADHRVIQQIEKVPGMERSGTDLLQLFSTKGASNPAGLRANFRPGNQTSNFFVNLQVQEKGYRAPQGGRVAGAGLGSDISAPEIRGAAQEIVKLVAGGQLASLDRVLGIPFD